jgi:glucose-1-phosphate thymidylyltransferase
MNAIVLAAGYATRLYPLTRDIAKPLLPLAGRPMIEYILDRMREVGDLEGVHVVTNRKFAPAFERWAAKADAGVPVTIHDDGTSSEDDRLGAIGDMRFVLERSGLDGEDLLVVAGDNLFEFSLDEYVRFWREKGEASALAVYELDDPELIKQYGVVELYDDDRVVSVEEKPAEPRSNLAATATYLFHASHARLVHRYLDEGNSPDQPGNFVVWLHTRAPVYGFRFRGRWLDIGNRAQLLEADNRIRRQRGMPERGEYSLD